MGIITLTSDLGYTDPYVALIKARICGLSPTAQIVDLSHQIQQYNIQHAGFVVRNCYAAFPTGSVHLICLNTAIDKAQALVAIKCNGHYFLGTDNGIFSLIFDEFPDEVVELNLRDEHLIDAFPDESVMAKAAVHLINGGGLAMLGSAKQSLLSMLIPKPRLAGNMLHGNVAYIDSFGNLITNLTKVQVQAVTEGRLFEISLRKTLRSLDRDGYIVSAISNSYNDVGPSDLVAVFNVFGLLEIAINQGNAAKLLGMKLNDAITLELL